MKSKFERFLSFIFKTEDISPNDKLSKKIKSVDSGEIDEDKLDYVTAAQKPDYEKMKSIIDSKKKK